MADPITVTDLENATLDVTTIAEVAMVGTTEDTVQNRDGDTLDTLQGRLNKVGFEPPIAYASGITFTDSQDSAKTIEESLVIYGCMPSARPFTTTGDFLADSVNFFVVQIAGTVSGNVRTDTDNTYDLGTTQTMDKAIVEGSDVKQTLDANALAASNAQSSADGAQSSADTADSKAVSAQSSADTAEGKADTNAAAIAALPTPYDYVTSQGSSGNKRYRKWSSGRVECWGIGQAISVTNGQVVTLPTSMPNSNYVIICNYDDGSAGDVRPVITGSRAVSQFSLSSAQTSLTCSWYAISL